MTVRPTRNRRWLPSLLVLALLVLILTVRQYGWPLRQAKSNPSMDTHSRQAAPAASIQGESEGKSTAGSAGRTPAATTERLRIYAVPGSYGTTQAASMAEPLEAALAYVEARTAMRLVRPVNIVFDRRPEGCGLDAVAYTDVRTLILYACPDAPTWRAVNILAHEFVHQLAHDQYGPAHLAADLILSEGLATWGAGRYWLGREASFHDFVASQYGHQLLPLATDPGADATAHTLNQLYYQWAAYVEWLRATYGHDALGQLYSTGAGRRPGSAGYSTVLGAGLAETEAHWRSWLEQTAIIDPP